VLQICPDWFALFWVKFQQPGCPPTAPAFPEEVNCARIGKQSSKSHRQSSSLRK